MLKETLISVLQKGLKGHWKDAKVQNEKWTVAKRFNDLYTYCIPYFENEKWELRYAWMCPECNKIHQSTGCSGLAGLEYPLCCGERTKHKYYSGIRTKL